MRVTQVKVAPAVSAFVNTYYARLKQFQMKNLISVQVCHVRYVMGRQKW